MTVTSYGTAMSIDPGGHIPLYLQVALALRLDIMDGTLQSGDTVPGENTLTSRFHVSKSVARQAIALLREEGLVITRRGAGSFVAAVPPRLTITVGRGVRQRLRMPSPEERKALGIPEGVPVLAILRPGSQAEELYDATRVEIEYG